jgi:hypothetical protein
MVLVIGFFVLHLRLLKTIVNLHDELIAGLQLVVNGRNAHITTRIGRHDGRVVP